MLDLPNTNRFTSALCKPTQLVKQNAILSHLWVCMHTGATVYINLFGWLGLSYTNWYSALVPNNPVHVLIVQLCPSEPD